MMSNAYAGWLSRRSRSLPSAALTVGALIFLLAAGPAHAAGCANEATEGFRPFLPDCRSYELVSPGFTDASRVGGTVVSSDGSRVIEESRGGYAAVESNTGETDYLLSRSNSGWDVKSLDPPTSLFPAQEFIGASPDLTKSLWIAREPSESAKAENFYIRAENGSMSEIGPLPNTADTAGPAAGEYDVLGGALSTGGAIGYRAASPDLSHIIFSMAGSGPTWPGDTTKRENVQSLYEYPGLTAKVPALVGVSDGHTVVNGITLPQGQLISSCGTFLGSSENNDLYNALAADGSVSFFTAIAKSEDCELGAPEVNELYARIDGHETVPISEPSSEACSVCSVPGKASEGRMSAEFVGASEDGSKVFFTTKQELFKGALGSNLYEYDFANAVGARLVRVSFGSTEPEVLGVMRVSEDGSHIYFVARGVLTPGQKDAVGLEPVLGGENLYVFVRNGEHPAGVIKFIGTLEQDKADWEAFDKHEAQATPDGQYFVFGSHADLVSGDTSTAEQVFEFNAADDELARVSIGAAGYANGAANASAAEWGLTSQGYARDVAPAAAHSGLVISEDGSTVAFTGVGALTSEAETTTNEGGRSVYVFDSPAGGRLVEGTVSYVSGSIPLPSEPREAVVGLTSSGSDLFFNTAEPLLVGDENTQVSTYDAKVEGGFPARIAPTTCSGEFCQGTLPGLPGFASPGSVGTPTTGNFPEPPRPVIPSPAQKLAAALKVCRRDKKQKKRRSCEAAARKKYKPKPKVKAKPTSKASDVRSPAAVNRGAEQ